MSTLEQVRGPRIPLRICSSLLAVLIAMPQGLGVAAQNQPTEPPPSTPPQGTQAPAPPTANSKLSGHVANSAGVATTGATVLAYHLSSEQLFRSTPTDAKGQFTFDAVPYGYFDLAVLSSEGLYVADTVVNVPPAGKTSVSLALTPGAPAETLRTFPGTEQQPVGIAAVNRKSGKGFWSSAGGIAIIAGGGAVALALLAGGGNGSESPASPSAP
jgi:carboxypeptidase family protein